MLKGKEKQHASKSPRCELLGGFPEGRSAQLGPPPLPPNKLWVKPTTSILLALRVCSFDLSACAPPASEAVEGVLGSGLCFPISLEGWQRRPSRLPHHCPLISFLHLFWPQQDAAPYRHKRRPEWAEETRPWAGPAYFSLGDVGGRDCQPVPDGGVLRPHPAQPFPTTGESPAHTLSSSPLLSDPDSLVPATHTSAQPS